MIINYKAVARDAAIVLGLTFLGGFVIGITSPNELNISAIAISNIVLSVVGFFIAGCLTKSLRFQHLSVVALCVWLVSAHNILLGVSFLQWVFSSVYVLITMGVGGGLSLLFVKPIKEENTRQM
jgi:hypothetical protein